MSETYIIVSDSHTRIVDVMNEIEKEADKYGKWGWEPVGNVTIDKEEREDYYSKKYFSYCGWLTMKRKLPEDSTNKPKEEAKSKD
jgi:hypothetical protein